MRSESLVAESSRFERLQVSRLRSLKPNSIKGLINLLKGDMTRGDNLNTERSTVSGVVDEDITAHALSSYAPLPGLTLEIDVSREGQALAVCYLN
jgi:hypothetical protein